VSLVDSFLDYEKISAFFKLSSNAVVFNLGYAKKS
jgi:hypothetical protein